MLIMLTTGYCHVFWGVSVMLVTSKLSNVRAYTQYVFGLKWLVSKETLCCVGGQVKQLVDYQLEVDKGKLTAVANLKS